MASSGAEIASAYVALTVKMPGIGRDVSRALGGNEVQSALSTGGKSMGAVLAGAVGGAVAAATTKAISMVTGAIGDAVKRVDIMNNFPKIMKNLGYSAKDATKSINKMSDGLKGLPTSLDSMAGMVQQLAPLTGGLGEATDLSLALNNALLAGGKSTDYQANAMEQYTQMLAIGKVDMAAWRSLVSAMPGQMDQLSVSLLGAGNKSMDLYEAMKSGEVTFDDFNQAVLKLNKDGVGSFASFEKQARDSTEGIGTGWANLQTAITRNLATIVQKLKPAIDAFLVGGTAIANALGPAFVWLVDIAVAVGDWASANRDWLGPAAVFVGTLLAVYKGTQAVRAVTLGYQAAMKGAQIATFLTGGALKTYNVITGITAVKTKVATVAQKAFNYAFKTNPIGVVVAAIVALVGALVYFFTSTETGKAIFAEFSRFLGEAWSNISAFFIAAYENVIKPVFDGIATVVTWVWQNVLQPIFQALGLGFAVLGGLIVGTYEALIKPVWDLFAAVVKWLWETIVRPVFAAMGTAFKAFGLVVQALWAKYVQPVFNFIGTLIRAVWTGYIKPVFDAISLVIRNTLGPVFTWLRDTVITPVWNSIKSVIAGVWNNGIKPVIDTMVKIVRSDPKRAFEAARDAIGKAWKGIQELAAKPVRFVVNTVINGLIGTINKIPGVNIPKVSLPQGFAHGGILPGMSRMSDGDDQLIMARRGEGMMVSEALRTSADRSAFLAANAAGRRGVGFASMLQGLARGGLVHPMPGAVMTTGWYGYPGHSAVDLAKPQGTPIQAAGAGTVSAQNYHNMYGNMVDIQHGGGLSTRYAHMLANVAVRLGQVVKAGQVIGYEGSTGNSTGPHLHYEVMIGGRQVNPIPYLNGGGVKPLFGVVDGLTEFATNTFKKAFPGGGMWIDAAGGIMSQGVKSVVGWATDLLSVGGDGLVPTLYDNGGWLQPGLSLVQNKTGAPEPILTSAQWDDMKSSRSADRGGLRAGERLTIVLDDGTELGGYVERRAGAVVDRKLAPVSAGALASSHGRRV